MAKCHWGVLITPILFHSAVVYGIPWVAAPSTVSVEHTSSAAPSATPGPNFSNGTNVESPNLCGYVEYSSSNPYTCPIGNTCLWNSRLGLVGCGNPTSVNYYTSCVPWRNIQYCNETCLSDPKILHCGASRPYCVTPIIDDNYSIYGCEGTRIFGRYRVHLTYSGQTTVGHLPRILGDDGNITYGTIIPSDSTSSPSNSPPTTSQTQDSFFVSTMTSTGPDFPRPTCWQRGNWSVHQALLGNGSDGHCQFEEQGPPRGNPPLRAEIIAGSVIGGFMFLITAGLLLWILLALRKLKRRKAKEEESETKDVRTEQIMARSVESGSISPHSGGGSRRTTSTQMSGGLPVRERGLIGVTEIEVPATPTSLVSETSGSRVSRGTSTLEAFDELYDDEDAVRRTQMVIPTVVLTEAEVIEATSLPLETGELANDHDVQCLDESVEPPIDMEMNQGEDEDRRFEHPHGSAVSPTDMEMDHCDDRDLEVPGDRRDPEYLHEPVGRPNKDIGN